MFARLWSSLVFLSEGVMMNSLANRKALVIALSVGVIGAGSLIAACSGSSNSTPGGGSGADSGSPGTTQGGDGGGNGLGPPAGSCTNPTIPIIFSPMYSAFIPNEDGGAIVFKIPAITSDGNSATWTFSDGTQVEPQTEGIPIDTAGDTVPGVMIQVNGVGAGSAGPESTGTVTVIATETGGACGTAVLTITQNTQDDWATGNARYNDGVAIHVGGAGGPGDGGRPPRPDGGFEFDAAGGGGFGLKADAGSYYEEEGGTACTNCHGATATTGQYVDVSHTPEQTGGFSDQQLLDIIVNGQIPDGGYFDPTVLVPNCDAGTVYGGPNMPKCMTEAFGRWHSFHQWVDITADEQPGIVCYLRSLAPKPQDGTSNFGGGHHRDGGGGGGPPPGGGTDSGGGPPPSDDAGGGGSDAGTGGD
jgi:hypothetical protein